MAAKHHASVKYDLPLLQIDSRLVVIIIIIVERKQAYKASIST